MLLLTRSLGAAAVLLLLLLLVHQDEYLAVSPYIYRLPSFPLSILPLFRLTHTHVM